MPNIGIPANCLLEIISHTQLLVCALAYFNPNNLYLEGKSGSFFMFDNFAVQCNLDLVTFYLVTSCDLVTILQRPFFNLLHKNLRFSDIMRFSDNFCRDQKCH